MTGPHRNSAELRRKLCRLLNNERPSSIHPPLILISTEFHKFSPKISFKNKNSSHSVWACKLFSILNILYIFLHLSIQHYPLIMIHQPITSWLLASKSQSEHGDSGRVSEVKAEEREADWSGHSSVCYCRGPFSSLHPETSEDKKAYDMCAHITEIKLRLRKSVVDAAVAAATYAWSDRTGTERFTKMKTAFSTLCSSLSLCRFRRNTKKNEGVPSKMAEEH